MAGAGSVDASSREGLDVHAHAQTRSLVDSLAHQQSVNLSICVGQSKAAEMFIFRCVFLFCPAIRTYRGPAVAAGCVIYYSLWGYGASILLGI